MNRNLGHNTTGTNVKQRKGNTGRVGGRGGGDAEVREPANKECLQEAGGREGGWRDEEMRTILPHPLPATTVISSLLCFGKCFHVSTAGVWNCAWATAPGAPLFCPLPPLRPRPRLSITLHPARPPFFTLCLPLYTGISSILNQTNWPPTAIHPVVVHPLSSCMFTLPLSFQIVLATIFAWRMHKTRCTATRCTATTDKITNTVTTSNWIRFAWQCEDEDEDGRATVKGCMGEDAWVRMLMLVWGLGWVWGWVWGRGWGWGRGRNGDQENKEKDSWERMTTRKRDREPEKDQRQETETSSQRRETRVELRETRWETSCETSQETSCEGQETRASHCITPHHNPSNSIAITSHHNHTSHQIT